MFSNTEMTFFQNGEEISGPGGYGQGPFSPSDTFECVLQMGRDNGAVVADILKSAGHVDPAMDQELRKKHGISDIYESEGIVSEALFQILQTAAPENVFGAKVALVHQNAKHPFRFLLLKDVIGSAGSDEVPGVYFWGMNSFKPEQAEEKKVFLLGDRARGDSEFCRLFMKLLCVREDVAEKIKNADLSCVQLSQFRI